MSGERGKEGVRPITPEDIAAEKLRQFPDAVFESFNELIIQKASVGPITIGQKDVVALMVEKGLVLEEIFKKGWLNVEDIYRQAGWKVEYDKPGYNETHPATFTFTPSKKRR